MKTKYKKETLEPIVRDSVSFSEVIRKLGISKSGTWYIKRVIAHLDIDTSHFLGSGYMKGKISKNRRSWESVLVLRDSSNYLEPSRLLRRSLIEMGRMEICEDCGLEKTWNGKPITLQIDHKNGNRNDNRPFNLRFLCPNCHTQTDNWGVQKISSVNKCAECKIVIGKHSTHCRLHSPKKRNTPCKIIWPSRGELIAMLKVSNYSAVGRKLGVSDNAVRKHLKKCE